MKKILADCANGCPVRVYAKGLCSKCYAAAWQAANREKVKAKHQAYWPEYYKANKEHMLAYQKRYRAANPEKVAADKRKWQAANRERILADKAAYYQANKSVSVAWAAANREARNAAQARRKMRGGMSMTAEDRRESVEWRKLIAGDPCSYCGAPGEHDDHYMPLAMGGTDHWWNLVRACAPCNLRKGATNGDEFIALIKKDTRRAA